MPPFRNAALGTSDVFEAGRTTKLVVDTVDGKWRRGLIVAAEEYRRVMLYGFTQEEIAEQRPDALNVVTETGGSECSLTCLASLAR